MVAAIQALPQTVQMEQRFFTPSNAYSPAIARWVCMLEDTRRRTVDALAGLSPEGVDWSSAEDNSIGSLLYHIALIEMSYLYEDILGLGWVAELQPLLPYDDRNGDGHLTAVHGESLDSHLERLAACRALLLQALGRMDDEALSRKREVEGAVISPEWAFHHLMQHEAEHRGQIVEIRAQVGKE